MSSESLGIDVDVPLHAEDLDVPIPAHEPPAHNELTLYPEKGRVYIDYSEGIWYVTDEQRALASGPWTAEYDDSGYCVLLYHGENEDVAPIGMSDFMRKSMWTKSGGELIHVQQYDGKPDKDRPYHSLFVTLKSGNLGLNLGHIQAEVSLEASVFLRPRSGSKVFIGLSSLYNSSAGRLWWLTNEVGKCKTKDLA